VPDSDRYARQRQVREVGASGQQRLLRLTVVTPAAASADLETLYLARAGVRVERCQLAPERESHLATEFAQAGPRALAIAAHRALCALRQGLDLDGPARHAPAKARLS
jgi:hypothetical protein